MPRCVDTCCVSFAACLAFNDMGPIVWCQGILSFVDLSPDDSLPQHLVAELAFTSPVVSVACAVLSGDSVVAACDGGGCVSLVHAFPAGDARVDVVATAALPRSAPRWRGRRAILPVQGSL